MDNNGLYLITGGEAEDLCVITGGEAGDLCLITRGDAVICVCYCVLHLMQIQAS